MPFGPREVRTMLEMDLAAIMLALTASRPFTRDLACCSLRMTKGRPYSSERIDSSRFESIRMEKRLSEQGYTYVHQAMD